MCIAMTNAQYRVWLEQMDREREEERARAAAGEEQRKREVKNRRARFQRQVRKHEPIVAEVWAEVQAELAAARAIEEEMAPQPTTMTPPVFDSEVTVEADEKVLVEA